MEAPRRCNCWTCRKRFSKTVSLIQLVPFARVIIARNWACRSVGKAGKGPVVMERAFSSVCCFTVRVLSPSVMEAPACLRADRKVVMC